MLMLCGALLYLNASHAAADRDIQVPIINLDKSISSVQIDGVPSNVEIPYCIESIAFTACVVVKDGALVAPLLVDRKVTGV